MKTEVEYLTAKENRDRAIAEHRKESLTDRSTEASRVHAGYYSAQQYRVRLILSLSLYSGQRRSMPPIHYMDGMRLQYSL